MRKLLKREEKTATSASAKSRNKIGVKQGCLQRRQKFNLAA